MGAHQMAKRGKSINDVIRPYVMTDRQTDGQTTFFIPAQSWDTSFPRSTRIQYLLAELGYLTTWYLILRSTRIRLWYVAPKFWLDDVAIQGTVHSGGILTAPQPAHQNFLCNLLGHRRRMWRAVERCAPLA